MAAKASRGAVSFDLAEAFEFVGGDALLTLIAQNVALEMMSFEVWQAFKRKQDRERDL